MPHLVPGMKQTTSQEENNYQDAIAESLELDKKERAQNDLESAQVDNAIWLERPETDSCENS